MTILLFCPPPHNPESWIFVRPKLTFAGETADLEEGCVKDGLDLEVGRVQHDLDVRVEAVDLKVGIKLFSQDIFSLVLGFSIDLT